MMNQSVTDAFNEQIKHELYSAYLYLSMAAHFESVNLSGFAHWMKLQSQEETGHAMRFFEFINDRGGKVVLHAIEQPPSTFQGPLSIFEQSLEHEKFITGRIETLYSQAVSANDYASQAFLQWFIDEQVEEEKNASQIIDTLRMVGENGAALFMVDRQLASRAAED